MAGLPPTARLRRAAEFGALRNATGRWQGRYFLLRWVATGQPEARVGMAVSRKVSKRAVVRNRIKRLIRESFRAQRLALPAFDVLVIARSAAAADTNPKLDAELSRAWRQLAALKQSSTPGTIGG